MVVGIGWWVVTEHDTRIEVQKENKQLRQDNNNLSEIISKQSLQFNRFNQIATSAYRYGIQAEVQSQERVIEHRTILKKEPTCDLLVPQPIADRLLKYTYELRSMYADTQNTNRASASTITTSTLTYCQAVLWIDPLLSALDKANGQLKGIRQIDAEG